MPKNAKKHECITCNFVCSKLSNFEKHLSTRKHLLEIRKPLSETEIMPQVICSICNQTYQSKSGLWKHMNKYHKEPIENEKEKEKGKDKEQTGTLVLDATTVLELIKQNQEFKSLILDQQNKLIELASKPNTVNNTSNSHNNNSTFNLQFFLNETCKDAMNLTDFVENLNIQLKEVENVGNNGFVTGISDIIVNRIKGLEVSKRPLHCTDVKRETMYIRDENEWNKDTDEKTRLRQFIGKVAKENMRKLPEWREENPECQNMHDEKYEYFLQLLRHSLGDLDERQVRMDEKIIKNIARQVAVDKNTIVYE